MVTRYVGCREGVNPDPDEVRTSSTCSLVLWPHVGYLWIYMTYRINHTMYIYQKGMSPQSSSWGYMYHTIIDNIYSNSTWVEPIKYRTEGETMIGRTGELKQMKLCGIQQKNQVLDNEA